MGQVVIEPIHVINSAQPVTYSNRLNPVLTATPCSELHNIKFSYKIYKNKDM